MGYRSDVYLKTTTEGWVIIKRYNDQIENIDHRPLRLAEVNSTASGFYKIEFHSIKWYEGYPEVDYFNKAVEALDEQDVPFSFIRLGEDTDDVEHRCNWASDMPDEISSFEPIVDVNDDDYPGDYTPVMLD